MKDCKPSPLPWRIRYSLTDGAVIQDKNGYIIFRIQSTKSFYKEKLNLTHIINSVNSCIDATYGEVIK